MAVVRRSRSFVSFTVSRSVYGSILIGATLAATSWWFDIKINETLFHWQSQNSSRPDIGRGLSYIQQQQNNKKILLFIREKANDEKGNTMGYVFIGEGNFKEYEDEKPMNIKWELNEPMPNYLWKESAKMSIG